MTWDFSCGHGRGSFSTISCIYTRAHVHVSVNTIYTVFLSLSFSLPSPFLPLLLSLPLPLFPSSGGSGVATLSDYHEQQPQKSSNAQQFYAGGSKHSRQMIEGPPRKKANPQDIAKEVFEAAKKWVKIGKEGKDVYTFNSAFREIHTHVALVKGGHVCWNWYRIVLNFRGRKLSRIRRKWEFHGENFHGLLET